MRDDDVLHLPKQLREVGGQVLGGSRKRHLGREEGREGEYRRKGGREGGREGGRKGGREGLTPRILMVLHIAGSMHCSTCCVYI
jgi:hypothetical protein